MARYYRRKRYYTKLYKNVTPGFGFIAIDAQSQHTNPNYYETNGQAIYVANNPVYVGNIKLRFGVTQFNHDNQVNVPLNPGIPWAVYYVAAGRHAEEYSFNEQLGDPWSPSKDVLATGVLTDTTTEHTCWLKRGRKLNTGDSIVFAIGVPGANPVAEEPLRWYTTSINVPLNITYKEYI